MEGPEQQSAILDPPSAVAWGRPMAALALAFAAGLAGERYAPGTINQGWLTAAIAILLCGQVSALFLWGFLRSAMLTLALFLCLGVLAGGSTTPSPSTAATLERFVGQSPTLFLAEIAAGPEPYPDKTRLALQLHRAYPPGVSVPLDLGVLLSVRDCRQVWLPGDLLLARLVLKRIHGFNNPGGYDYERVQAERGFFATAFLADDQFLVKLNHQQNVPLDNRVSSLTWLTGLDRFRLNALNWMNRQLEPSTAAIYAALLLGYQNRVSKPQQEHWNRAGVTHLLSISGQHLGLVAMAAFWLLRRLLRLRPKLLERTSDQHLALGGALLLALLYAVIGGMALATWRSAIMLTLFFAGIYCYRPPDLPSALSSAALIILVMQPSSLWNPSFQLSFGALFGIFILYPRLSSIRRGIAAHAKRLMLRLPGRWFGVLPSTGSPHARRFLGPFADAFWVSLAANIMVLPLVAHHFHGVSLAGLAANTLLVPLVGFLTLPLGLLSLALFAVSPWAAAPFLVVGGWTVALGEHLIVFFSERSWAYFWVGDVPTHWMAAGYALMGLLLTSWRWRTKMISAGMGLALCGLLAWLPPALPGNSPTGIAALWRKASASGWLQILVVDVGQGSSTLVRFPTGQTMLVDGGGFYDDAFDIGRNVLAPVLWHLGVNKLDYVVLSHDHPDHRNGLRFILAHFPVGDFWETNIHENMQPGSLDVLNAIAQQRTIPIRTIADTPLEESLDKCRIACLHPSRAYRQTRWDGKDLNNVSLVLQVDYADTHLILPGDIDQSVEQLLFADFCSTGKVLLVAPHHGSHRSNSPLLFARLQPQAVVFSCGYENWFHFPDRGVLEHLNKSGIPAYRTDLHGAIWAGSDGTTWEIHPVKENPIPLSPGVSENRAIMHWKPE
jgi:competence protein ComEC